VKFEKQIIRSNLLIDSVAMMSARKFRRGIDATVRSCALGTVIIQCAAMARPYARRRTVMANVLRSAGGCNKAWAKTLLFSSFSFRENC
jgi:hypothetical protein